MRPPRAQEHGPFDVVHFHEFGGAGYYPLLAKRQGLALRGTHVIVGVHGCAARVSRLTAADLSVTWTKRLGQRVREPPQRSAGGGPAPGPPSTRLSPRRSPLLSCRRPTLWAKRDGNGQPLDHVADLELDWMERKSVELADTVVSPSAAMPRWLERAGWAADPSGLRVLPNLPPDVPPDLAAADARGPRDPLPVRRAHSPPTNPLRLQRQRAPPTRISFPNREHPRPSVRPPGDGAGLLRPPGGPEGRGAVLRRR